MGKVIQFGTAGSGGTGYSIYTIAGLQYDSTGNTPTNFSAAKPTVVNQSGITQDKSFALGLSITKATTSTSDVKGVHPLSGIGFFSTFGSYDVGGNLNSGSQSLLVVPIYGNLNEDTATMLTDIASSVTDDNVDTNPAIKLCFDSGKNRYGMVTLGGTGSQRLATTPYITHAASDC